MRLLGFVKRNIFLVGIISVLMFSLLMPGPGLFLTKNGILSPLTFAAMFISGLGLSLERITQSIKNFKAIVYSLISVFVLFPLIVFVISNSLVLDKDMLVGAAILAAQSSTLATAVVLTVSANGNVPLALIMTIINNISSTLLTPLVLRLTLSLDQQIDFDVRAMIIKLLWVLVLPVVLAQVVRFYFGKYVSRVNKVRKAGSKLVVLSFVLAGAASASSKISSNIQFVLIALGLVIAIHMIMITLSVIYSRVVKLDTGSKIAVMFCSSQKTLPASLYIWESFFPGYLLAPIFIIAYHLMQVIIDSIIVSFFQSERKRSKIEKDT